MVTNYFENVVILTLLGLFLSVTRLNFENKVIYSRSWVTSCMHLLLYWVLFYLMLISDGWF